MKTKSGIVANTIYMLAFVMELFVTDLTQRMKAKGIEWKYEKKRAFNDLIRNAKGVDAAFDVMEADLWTDSKTAANYQDWQDETNYMARILLLYVDRFSNSEKAKAELYEFMKSRPSELNVVDDAMLETFTLK